jgi:predicted kinase
MLICHVLIGIPGSGKTSLAQAWLNHDRRYVYISTDAIRSQLYGNADIQGEWSAIEAEVLKQITDAIESQRPVIYDATHVKRSWRISFLQQVREMPCDWIGWILPTDLDTCLAQNKQRDRQVQESIIRQFHEFLRLDPPDPSEGFAGIYPVPYLQKSSHPSQFDFQTIDRHIQQVILNQSCSTSHANQSIANLP